MIQIYFHQNQNKLQAIALGFVIFTVKFGTLSHPGRLGLACEQTSLCEAKEIGAVCKQAKLGLVSSENLFKVSQRKDSYGTIFADLCRAV